MSVTLTSNAGGTFTLHPAGIFPAVCVDVIDLGAEETNFDGKAKMVNKLSLVFETEELGPDGKRLTAKKKVTASLHPKSGLAKIIGSWRGKPVAIGESINLDNLIGASCTLVLSHAKSEDGTRDYVNFDTVTKPTKKLTASGDYNKVEARNRINEWRTKNGLTPIPNSTHPPTAPAKAAPVPMPPSKSSAAKVAAQDEIPMGDSQSVDPEVGF